MGLEGNPIKEKGKNIALDEGTIYLPPTQFQSTRPLYKDERKDRDGNQLDRKVFNTLILDVSLMEMPSTERSFIWSNMQVVPRLAKLGRSFVFMDWDNHFPLA